MKTQKPNHSNPIGRRSPLQRAALAAGIVFAGVSMFAHSISAQTLIYQEGFNDDGEKATPPRYTTIGRDVYDLARIRSANIVDQLGPIYWAHNFEVPNSFVGV